LGIFFIGSVLGGFKTSSFVKGFSSSSSGFSVGFSASLSFASSSSRAILALLILSKDLALFFSRRSLSFAIYYL